MNHPPAHLAHLSRDPILEQTLTPHDPCRLTMQPEIWLQVCDAVISQQLNTRVARILQQRLRQVLGAGKPRAERLREIPFDTLKGIGLSRSKTEYLRNIADYFIQEKLTDRQLQALPDEDVIESLTRIRGVGRWTAEMVLMFALGREDVFAVNDLGIRQKMTYLYGVDPSNAKVLTDNLIRISEAWRPYRSYACLYLWRFSSK